MYTIFRTNDSLTRSLAFGGLEIDDGFENIHVGIVPAIDFSPTYHQVYSGVMCGEATFFQRCFVYRTTNLPIPLPTLVAFPPDWILGGDRDLDDFVLQVAVVGRESWLEIAQAENQQVVNKRFTESALPRGQAEWEAAT